MSWIKSKIWHDSYIRNVIDSNRLAHSYIFLGPDQHKKIWTALSMAKTLFCRSAVSDFCDECSACKKVESHNHPDVLWVRPTGALRMIKIDAVRSLQATLSLKSFEGGKKIAFIIDADRMREDAANAMLKTIEEPADNTILILFATNIEGFLPTIVSRCQQVYFPVSSQEEIEKYLIDELHNNSEQARLIASISQGSYTLLHKYLDAERRQWREYVVNSVLDLITGKSDPFELAEQIEKNITEIVKNSDTLEDIALEELGLPQDDNAALSEMEKKALEKNIFNEEVTEFFQYIELLVRDITVYKETGDDQTIINLDKIDKIKRTADAIELKVLYTLLDDIQNAYTAFKGNTGLQFVLEILFDRVTSRIDRYRMLAKK